MKKLLAILLLLVIDPVLSQELDLTNAIPSGPLIQNSGFENCQIFQGGATCGEWNNTGLGDWGKYENSSKEFLFSYDITRLWQDIDITDFNTGQFAYYFYFDLNASCKNSIGGYCENPDGPADFFSARLNFYSGDTLFKQDILLDGPIYTQDWTPFLFLGQIDSANQITSIQVEFYGQDVGYWAGFYGPRLDNVNFSINYLEAQIAPDCTVNPNDVSCIINSTPTTTVVADNTEDTTPTEPVVEQKTEEPVLAGPAPDLESLLADEKVEEKSEKEIKDEIPAELLQQVLTTVETQETERERNTTKGFVEDKEIVVETTEVLVADNKTVTTENEETKQTETEETVETELVANTTETETIVETKTEETITVELPVFVQNQTESVIESITIENVIDETVNEESFVANQIEQATEIDDELIQQIDEITNRDSNEVSELNNILVTIQQDTFSDEQTEDEQLTMAYVQPESNMLSNSNLFNVEPNMADKEASGVLGKVEEKSDAEKRADEIVAANKEQQEEINKNYMDADQSGIVAAMGGDVDVSSYRTAMIPELSVWYKPEDIYKNVVIKDNVRGSYFLEKGNTDTYKKMVDEQYK